MLDRPAWDFTDDDLAAVGMTRERWDYLCKADQGGTPSDEEWAEMGRCRSGIHALRRAIEPLDLWMQGDLPTLPRGVLPPVIEALARHAAEVNGFDAGYVGMACMAVAAAAIPHHLCVQVKASNSTWIERAILWVMMLGGPSVKKTPVHRMTTKVLRRIDAEHARRFKREMAEHLAARKELGRNTEAIAGLTVPTAKHVLVSDFTTEALSEVLKDEVNSDGRLMVAMDEGIDFVSASGYNGGGSTKELTARTRLNDSNGEWVQRIKRGKVFVEVWAACFLGGTQPDTLIQALKRLPNNGFLQRMFWLTGAAAHGLDKPFDDTLLQDYERHIERLHQIDGSNEKGDTVCQFSPEAHVLREAFFDELESLQRLVAHDEPMLAEHVGKWPGAFARLCLVDHIFQRAPGDIKPETVARMIRLFKEYLIPQTTLFYRTIGDNNARDQSPRTTTRVAQVASLILRARLEELTATKLQRQLAFWRKAEPLEQIDILNTLVNAGWIIPERRNEDGRIVELNASRARSTGWLYRTRPAVHDGRFEERRIALQAAADALVDARKLPRMEPPAESPK